MASILDELREASKKTDQRFMEMEKRAEELHLQSMASKEKPSIEAPVVSIDSGNPRSKNGVTDEAPRVTVEASNNQTDGPLKRVDTGLLVLPPTATPLRSAEMNTPSYKGGSSGYYSHQKNGSSPKKLDLPEFERKNPDNWIFRVEKCFKVNQTEDDEKLSLAMDCLVGCAVTWLRMIQDRDELLDWRDFKMKLKRRFKTTKGGTILSQMLRLRQTGTISEYREQFEESLLKYLTFLMTFWKRSSYTG